LIDSEIIELLKTVKANPPSDHTRLIDPGYKINPREETGTSGYTIGTSDHSLILLTVH